MLEIKHQVFMGSGEHSMACVGECFSMLGEAFTLLNRLQQYGLQGYGIDGLEDQIEGEQNRLQSIAKQLYIGLTGVNPLHPVKKEDKSPKSTMKPPVFDSCIYVVMYWNGRRWSVKNASLDLVQAKKILEDVHLDHVFCMLVKTSICEIVAMTNQSDYME